MVLFGRSSSNSNGNTIALSSRQTSTLYTTFSIPASAAAVTTVSGTMYPFGLQQPSQTSIVVPSTEKWYLADFYVDSSLSIDVQIQLVVNGIPQALVVNLNSTIVTNSARFVLPTPILIMPNQTFSVNFITYTANSATTAVSENCFLVFLREPI
jgi:hypothetical protein